MRAFVILVLLGLLGACRSRTSEFRPAPRLNVLFLICDDLNCDLGCYGHPVVQTPNIDRLAKRGVRFDNAYCQYPLCGPSRASFMSGLYPDQTLIHRNAVRIRERLPNILTMSQLFRKHGYTAVRIGKIYHYNVPADIGKPGHDDPASWEITINPRGRDKDEEAKIFSLVPGRYGGTMSWLAADGTDEEQTDGIAATEAVKLLEAYGKNKTPFFMAVGLYRPHTPYVAPRKYFDMYPRNQITVPRPPAGYLETLPKSARKSITRKKDQLDLDEGLARQAIQAYYASITFADAQLGRILDALDRTGLSKNTVVLFTSDHGYHMGEHGWWQKTTLFDNAARVPLIISVPGMRTAGQTATSPVEMVDFYPTLAEVCRLPKPEHLAGVSLVPALRDVSATPRESALTQYANGYSIRTARYRYTSWDPNGIELYDHQADPDEMVNLASDRKFKPLMIDLQAILESRIRDAKEAPPGLTQIPPPKRKKKKKK